jgi:hypothetical protein
MQKKYVIAALVTGVVGAVAGSSWNVGKSDSEVAVNELQAEVTTLRDGLLGYTKYTDYLYASKQKLQEQMKFIAATVVRGEGYTRVINKSILGVNFNSTVAILYTAEYTFGYTLKPEDYDITSTDGGIRVTLKKPMLVAPPATRNLRHQILSGSVFTNSQAAVIGLYEGIDKRTLASSRSMAADEAVIALCEKKLLAFLGDFLAKQPGVKHVPNIIIAYK